MKVSQLDQIKQAYEEAVCTVQSIALRIKAMKEVALDECRDHRTNAKCLETYGDASSNPTVGAASEKDRDPT